MIENKVEELFRSKLSSSHPNEWEIDEIIEYLSPLNESEYTAILSFVPAFWPISHALCYSYIKHSAQQNKHLPIKLLSDWVRQILFHYEKGGLRKAEQFMLDVPNNFINTISTDTSIHLADIKRTMTHYIRGISKTNINLAEDIIPWCDTATIYLPPTIDLFPSADGNKLIYKFLTTYQWAQTHLGMHKFLRNICTAKISGDTSSEILVSNPNNLKDIPWVQFKLFIFIETFNFLREYLPGLANKVTHILQSRLTEKPILSISNSETSNSSLQLLLTLLNHRCKSSSATEHFKITEYYNFIDNFHEFTTDDDNLLQLLLGEIKPKESFPVIKKLRKEQKNQFMEMLSKIIDNKLLNTKNERENALNNQNNSVNDKASIARITQHIQNKLNRHENGIIKIDNEQLILSDEIVELASKIQADLGNIPDSYFQAKSGLSSGGIIRANNDHNVEQITDHGTNSTSIHTYDEWDCRRNGYRKDWCIILEEEIKITKSNFIEQTLSKHVGLRKRLMLQFEMLKTSARFIGRQRDGDDLDLDAITDAIGDRRAGKPSTDKLFVRLQKNDRDITTLFLIDMSNSTTGWIGNLIKESLALLCEALEMIGDEYGIYGFSGMKRSGCKLYHIKHLHEPYNQETKDRISSISPKDYTRMGPAIRHLTTILKSSDSRTRLLISLSDGKPEDYDGYNGEYAIEDTRKALLEAKGVEINPFCITIDKRAHDYLDHMYGNGNYIFIDKIESLPSKIPTIYRTLTR